MIIVPLLNAGAQVQFAPRHLVFLAPIVTHFEVVATVRIELPHVLDHGIAPDSATHPVANMVINLAVIHDRAAPLIKVSAVPAKPGGGGDGIALSYHLNDRQAGHVITADRESSAIGHG